MKMCINWAESHNIFPKRARLRGRQSSSILQLGRLSAIICGTDNLCPSLLRGFYAPQILLRLSSPCCLCQSVWGCEGICALSSISNRHFTSVCVCVCVCVCVFIRVY